jgi:hypothetical protein
VQRDNSLARTPADHPVGIGLGHRAARKLARAEEGRRKEKGLWVNEACAVDISVQVGIQIVMAGHFMALTAFFVQPDPGAPLLDVNILNPHLKSSADSGESVDHQRD